MRVMFISPEKGGSRYQAYAEIVVLDDNGEVLVDKVYDSLSYPKARRLYREAKAEYAEVLYYFNYNDKLFKQWVEENEK